MTISRSPVARLTLWYTLIIMLVSLTFSGAIYELSAYHFRASFPSPDDFTRGPGSIFTQPYEDQIAELIESRYQQAIFRLRMSLIILNAAMLVGAGFTSYWLAKRTLHPIEQALDDQRKFTADASHELRTPLAAMKTEIEVALHNHDTSEHTQILQSNLEEISKLEKLAAALLQLARHEDASQQPVMESVVFSQIVTEATQRVTAVAKRKEINIKTESLNGTVRGEPGSLVELLVILLDNAIKYSPNKSGIRVVGDNTKKEFEFRVIDQGVGIAAADLPHVFKRFYRADRSRSKKQIDGHGLGLSIAKQIVELHHGQISIASEVGRGTTVTIIIPKTTA